MPHKSINAAAAPAIVCRRPNKSCVICGATATRLCDWLLDPGTCDRPLCDEHAHRAVGGVDYCPEHYAEVAAKRRQRLDMMEKLIMDGAEVRLGSDRVQVIYDDGEGCAEMLCDISVWGEYQNEGRAKPKNIGSGMKS